jgi:type II secretory pathway component PulC
MRMQVVRLVGAAVLGVSMVSCSSTSLKEPRFIEDIRPVPPPLKVMHLSIQRRDLQEALNRQGDNAIRLVPVFDNISVKQTYSYRLFDVNENSAYALLGLQSSDVVVAADRYLIKRPDQFPAFVSLLAGADQATIEIRRGGEGRLLKYSFIPAAAKRDAGTEGAQQF